MATGPKYGLSPARKVGSTPNNMGFDEYTIASGYSTAIYTGEPVAISSGTIVRATDGSDVKGVLLGVSLIDSNGVPQEKSHHVASFTSSYPIKAKVMDDPFQTFVAKGNGTTAQVVVGGIYAVDWGTPNTVLGRSGMTAKVLAERVGDIDISAITDLGANVSGLVDNDSFSVRSNAGESATTIVIEDGDGFQDLLDKLNAVANITASLTSGGFLRIQADNGYSLILANVVNTPLEDFFAAGAATTAPTVAANAGMFKVQKVLEDDTLLVTLVNHNDRDDG